MPSDIDRLSGEFQAREVQLQLNYQRTPSVGQSDPFRDISSLPRPINLMETGGNGNDKLGKEVEIREVVIDPREKCYICLEKIRDNTRLVQKMKVKFSTPEVIGIQAELRDEKVKIMDDKISVPNGSNPARAGENRLHTTFYCRHVSHEKCVYSWMRAGGDRCGLCQAPFSDEDFPNMDVARAARKPQNSTNPPPSLQQSFHVTVDRFCEFTCTRFGRAIVRALSVAVFLMLLGRYRLTADPAQLVVLFLYSLILVLIRLGPIRF